MNHWPTVEDPRYSTRMRRAMHGLEEFLELRSLQFKV